MKNILPITLLLLLFVFSCHKDKQKDCPDLPLLDYNSCIKDSASVKHLIVGTWDWVGNDRVADVVNACKVGETVTQEFDSTGNYKYYFNGAMLHSGHYTVTGDSIARIYDSTFTIPANFFCGGYLIESVDTFFRAIYARRK